MSRVFGEEDDACKDVGSADYSLRQAVEQFVLPLSVTVTEGFLGHSPRDTLGNGDQLTLMMVRDEPVVAASDTRGSTLLIPVSAQVACTVLDKEVERLPGIRVANINKLKRTQPLHFLVRTFKLPLTVRVYGLDPGCFEGRRPVGEITLKKKIAQEALYAMLGTEPVCMPLNLEVKVTPRGVSKRRTHESIYSVPSQYATINYEEVRGFASNRASTAKRKKKATQKVGGATTHHQKIRENKNSKGASKQQQQAQHEGRRRFLLEKSNSVGDCPPPPLRNRGRTSSEGQAPPPIPPRRYSLSDTTPEPPPSPSRQAKKSPVNGLPKRSASLDADGYVIPLAEQKEEDGEYEVPLMDEEGTYHEPAWVDELLSEYEDVFPEDEIVRAGFGEIAKAADKGTDDVFHDSTYDNCDFIGDVDYYDEPDIHASPITRSGMVGSLHSTSYSPSSSQSSRHASESTGNSGVRTLSTSSSTSRSSRYLEMSQGDIAALSVDDVGQLLDDLNLSGYRDLFRKEQIDGELLTELDHDMLEELGLTSKLHRHRLLRVVHKDSVL